MFRHNGIFVSTKSGIREPKDLVGKRIGVPEYQLTAPVWMRGILQDEYGVDPASVEYFTGGEEEPGREEKVALDLPREVPRARRSARARRCRRCSPRARSTPSPRRATPRPSRTRPDRVKRLFENYVEVERAYFRKTTIFPIMHTVVLRRELYEAHPWIAQSLDQGVRRGQAPGPGQSRHRRRDQDHAAVADRPCRRDAARDGRGLVALWLRGQPPRARNLPALSPRAGPVAAGASSPKSCSRRRRSRRSRSDAPMNAGRVRAPPPRCSCCATARTGSKSLMLERHRDDVVFAGALVFPGGRVDAADGEPACWRAAAAVAGIGAAAMAFRIAAIRESLRGGAHPAGAAAAARIGSSPPPRCGARAPLRHVPRPRAAFRRSRRQRRDRARRRDCLVRVRPLDDAGALGRSATTRMFFLAPRAG